MAHGNAGACLDAFLARPEVRARLLDEPSRPVRRLLPLKPIARTWLDRVLVVGDAGGFTKPTTGGGIFYSLLTASLAAATLVEGFGQGRLDEAFLARYERRWQERLGADLQDGRLAAAAGDSLLGRRDRSSRCAPWAGTTSRPSSVGRVASTGIAI